jgi:hypothetical protein
VDEGIRIDEAAVKAILRRVDEDGNEVVMSPELIAKEKAEAEERNRVWEELRKKQEYESLHAVELEIEKLRKESAERLIEADKLERLFKAFPDLRKNTNRWNTVRYYSKSVNTRVTRFDLKHNCGCCNDSPLELWPYLETPDGNVYSDPPRFTVGEKHWICGDDPRPGWKDELRAAGLPEIIIGAVSMHFKQGAEERREAAESSNYDDDA